MSVVMWLPTTQPRATPHRIRPLPALGPECSSVSPEEPLGVLPEAVPGSAPGRFAVAGWVTPAGISGAVVVRRVVVRRVVVGGVLDGLRPQLAGLGHLLLVLAAVRVDLGGIAGRQL